MEDLKLKYPDQDILKILLFINQRKGLDLMSYRRSFVDRHLRSRLAETEADNYLDYINRLKRDPGELDKFLDELSINVTSFFRDRDVFNSFKTLVVPELLQNPEKKLIRIWSAACASGQEPYSIAMALSEAIGGREFPTVRIWATDVDEDALERARRGEYEEPELKGITDSSLVGKYFDRGDDGSYTAKDGLKSLIRFEKHNLITDPPLKFMDVVFCRNVMIYFNREQQESLMAKFAQGLNSRGFLVVAKVESVWDKDVFVPVDAIRKIYRKAQ